MINPRGNQWALYEASSAYRLLDPYSSGSYSSDASSREPGGAVSGTSSSSSAGGSVIGYIQSVLNRAHSAALDQALPGWREKILGPAAGAVHDLEELSRRFSKDVLPEATRYANQIGMQALRNVASMTAGEVPSDVLAQMRRHEAETMNRFGIRGEAAEASLTRNLGLTSLQLMTKGQELMEGAASFLPRAYTGFSMPAMTTLQGAKGLADIQQSYLPKLMDPNAAYSVYEQSRLGGARLSMEQSAQTFGQSTATRQMDDAERWNQINWAAMQRGVAAVDASRPATGQMSYSLA